MYKSMYLRITRQGLFVASGLFSFWAERILWLLDPPGASEVYCPDVTVSGQPMWRTEGKWFEH